jgi:pyridoxamine 5'-phosphate oxidase-like protein
MGKFSNVITTAHKEFIEKQHIFFVGTTPLDSNGRVNLSPKGLDSFRVIDDATVAYMDLIGSGNETSAHILENGRITFMFCSFDKVPNILRLYGKGTTILRSSKDWDYYSSHFVIYPSTRQIIVAEIDLVQTSCGFGVPLYEYLGDRDQHFAWAEKMGDEGLAKYMQEKNISSIDHLPTQLGLN